MVGLGMQEIILILVIALIVFGPRKLPELGKSLGSAMAQFRKASDEFKRTWEQEVELEKVRKGDLASSSYESNYQSETGYGTESDYNYGYNSTGSDSLTASEAQNDAAEPATAEPVDAAAVVEKKGEPHWI